VQPGDWRITQLAYSPDGRRLAVAHDRDSGNLVSLMDTRTRRLGPRLELYDYMREITGLHFAGADSVDVVSIPVGPEAAPRTTIERFDARSGHRILGPLAVGHAPSPVLATGNRRVLTVTADALVIRDGLTLRPLRRFGIGASTAPRAAGAFAVSPDDHTVAIGEADGVVRRASGRHGGRVTAALFTPDGRSLVTASDDGDAILWDVRRRAATETLSGHASGIAALQLTPDGHTLFSAGLDGSMLVWDLAGTRRLGRPFEAGGSTRARAALSADGRRLAIGQQDGRVSIVDLRDPQRRRTFPVVPEGGAIGGIRFVPGGPLAVVTGSDGYTALVDTEKGRVVRTLRDPSLDPLVGTPGISADGRLLAVPQDAAGNLIDVGLWTLPEGRSLGAPLRVDHEIRDVQVSPDGRLLLVDLVVNAGLDGGAVEAWDVRSRRRVRRLHFARLPAFARFSPDGRRFAVGNRYGETRVYDAATFKPVTRVLSGGAGAIVDAAITRDGRMLATGSETGGVQLWDIPTGQALGAPLPGVPSHAVTPAFAPDGGHLVAAYDTGRAYLWDIRPASLAQHACEVAGRRLTRSEWTEFLPGRPYDPAC
jgi:WD40 repeat protein